MKWRCTVCDYIHEGDNPPESCPICGVDASNFVKVEEETGEDSTNLKKREDGGESSQELKGKITQERKQEMLSPEEAIKKAIRSISYGLFIITASYGGKDNGQTANTCFQITSEPVQIAIGVNKNNYTHELITQSGKFGVSILDQNGHDLARRFGYKSGRDINKFEGIKAHRGHSGVMLPDGVLAAMEVEVVNKMDTGTHTLFLGKVTAGEFFGNGEPMTYAFFRKRK